MPKFVVPTLAVFLFLFTSCVKQIDDYVTPNPVITDMHDLVAPGSFNYQNSKSIHIDLQLSDNNDDPIAFVKVRFMSDTEDNGGRVLGTAFTESNGRISCDVLVPTDQNALVINTNCVGVPNDILINQPGNSIQLSLGGSNPANFTNGNDFLADESSNQNKNATVPVLSYLGNWNNQGVPLYLSSPRMPISGAFISRINRSLPEHKSVATYRPQYLNAANALTLTQQADVYLSFVHENSSWKNTLAYFPYNKNNPPQTLADIPQLKVVLPNSNFRNAGGGLISGDKVYLGKFGADTVIGFALLTNSFNSNSHSVNNGTAQYYSLPHLNPESSASKRIHAVYLWDDTESKMIVGFEERNRDGNADHDFNDLIVVCQSVPSTAIYNNNYARCQGGHDSDNDDCDDEDDESPNDPTASSYDFYPGPNSFGHLAFEDLWPYQGDFDFNDLVVGYQFKQIKNRNNLVTAIDAKLFVKAAGGSYRNGLGIELPVPPSFIQSVTGSNLKMNYIVNNGNGTEAGQNKAVIIAFDNSQNIAPRPASYYVNTQIGSPVVVSDTVNLHITFVSPLSQTSLGLPPYNPFVISDMRRGYEIHLANKPPTSLAQTNLFGTGNDRSNLAGGSYYKSDKNLPWAIDIPANYAVVVEKSQMIDAYLRFSDWCLSNGTEYTDWYQDLPGYRDNSALMNR